jgi:hypothetical protein
LILRCGPLHRMRFKLENRLSGIKRGPRQGLLMEKKTRGKILLRLALSGLEIQARYHSEVHCKGWLYTLQLRNSWNLIC